MKMIMKQKGINATRGLILLIFILAALIFLSSCDSGKYLNPVESTVEDTDIIPDVIDPELPREAIVVIDPGHGGVDVGTVYKDLYEKDFNLDIALKLGELLDKEGISNVFTRNEDTNPGLRERAETANTINAALFISIHNNEMTGQPGYKGTETLYCPVAQRQPDAFDGKKFAAIIQEELVKKLGTVDNGIISRPNLAVLRLTKMPAVIAEVAYLSNPSDRANLTNEKFRQKAADALRSAVLKSFEKMGIEKDKEGKWMIIPD